MAHGVEIQDVSVTLAWQILRGCGGGQASVSGETRSVRFLGGPNDLSISAT